MQVSGGKIHFGHGDLDHNAGPIPIVAYDPATSSFGTEYTADEEQLSRLRIINGLLTVPGDDPRETWDFGNFYRKETSGWVKYRTIPNAIHTWDMYTFGSLLFATISPNGGGTSIKTSSDNGLTWQNTTYSGTISFNATTVFSAFFELNGALYASQWDTNHDLTRYQGSNTFVDMGAAIANGMFPNTPQFQPGFVYTRVERPVNYAGQLVYLGVQPDSAFHMWVPVGIYKASAIDNVQKITFSAGTAWDIEVGTDGFLYILTNKRISANQFTVAVHRTSDLSNWTEVLSFSSGTYARSFARLDPSFYFGLGGDPVLTSNLTGNVLRLTP
jgi:hypothetical protein